MFCCSEGETNYHHRRQLKHGKGNTRRSHRRNLHVSWLVMNWLLKAIFCSQYHNRRVTHYYHEIQCFSVPCIGWMQLCSDMTSYSSSPFKYRFRPRLQENCGYTEITSPTSISERGKTTSTFRSVIHVMMTGAMSAGEDHPNSKQEIYCAIVISQHEILGRDNKKKN